MEKNSAQKNLQNNSHLKYPRSSYHVGMSSSREKQMDCPYRIKRTIKRRMFPNFFCCCFVRNKRNENNFNRIDSIISTNSSSLHPETGQRYSYTKSSTRKNAMCGPFSWFHLPILISITSCVGFIATYFFAKSNCHIEKWIFPYLSYTGTEVPESMVFGMILNTEGFLGLIVVFLAWRYYRHMGQTGCLNTMCLIFGFLSCLGTIIVGNFQVSKAKIPHYLGAGLAFIIGTAFSVFSSILSRRTFKLFNPPLKYSRFIGTLRIVIAFIMVIALTLVSGVGMYKKLSSRNRTNEVPANASLIMPDGSCRNLLKNIPLYVRYIDLVGSTTEWLLTACMLFCLSLYAYEFKTFQYVKVILKDRRGPLCCDENTDLSLQPLTKESTTPSSRSNLNLPVQCDTFNNNKPPGLPHDSGIEDNTPGCKSPRCESPLLGLNNQLILPQNSSITKSLPNLNLYQIV